MVSWAVSCKYVMNVQAFERLLNNPKPQGHVQVLLNILRGFTVQAALDAPRFCISAGSPDHQTTATGDAGDINSEVYFEETFPAETIEKLRGMFQCVLAL